MNKRCFRLRRLFLLFFCMSLGFLAKSQTAKADLMLDGSQIDGSCAVFFDQQPLREIRYNGTVVWRAGADITYFLDDGICETHFVPYGQTTLSVTGSKEEYEFIGWREDTAASGEVLETDLCTGDEKNLYAVFQKGVTITYYNGSSIPQTSDGYIYYNNGNISYPEFTISQAMRDGWTSRGWTTGKAADAEVVYHELDHTELASDMTLYGAYQKTVTASFDGNGAGGGSTAALAGTAYYNSAGTTINPSFKLPVCGFTKSGCSFSKWAMGSAGGTQYSAGASITLSGNAAFYAVWTAPFYIVQDRECRQALSFTVVDEDNTSGTVHSFRVGEGAQLRAWPDDNSQPFGAEFVSDGIEVNGNQYIRITVEGAEAASVSGATLISASGETRIWAISSPVIRIHASASSFAYGNAAWTPIEIYLY